MNNDLVGRKFVFDDGSVIQVIQIKNRDYDESVEPFITFTVSNGNSLPRKLVMREQEFRDTYGHLFEEGEDNAL